MSAIHIIALACRTVTAGRFVNDDEHVADVVFLLRELGEAADDHIDAARPG
jgi:hypothetical protein